MKDKLKGKTKQDERRSNMTLSFEQPKSPLENLNKSFLSPAFKKFLGLDVETEQEDEKPQGNKEELKPEVSSR